ncbi:MAG: hypothetical protein WCB92_29530 [Mycobacterium sp.]
MKQFIIAGVGTALAFGALIAAAPQASAGCQYGGLTVSKCDGPVQPDGTWQRCAVFSGYGSGRPYYSTNVNCQTLGPDQHPWGLAFNFPSEHIDD